MTTITIASLKGGVGSTTLAILISKYLYSLSYSVRLLDFDNINQLAILSKEKSEMFSFSNLNKESVYDIEEYEADFAVIDLPKSINEYWLYVLSKSDVVIVPYEHSLMDYIKLRALWGFIYKEPLIKSRVFFLCNKASETRAKKNVANIENLFGESLSLSTKFSLPDIPFSNTIAMRPLNESLTKTEAELIRPLCTTLLKSVF